MPKSFGLLSVLEVTSSNRLDLTHAFVWNGRHFVPSSEGGNRWMTLFWHPQASILPSAFRLKVGQYGRNGRWRNFPIHLPATVGPEQLPQFQWMLWLARLILEDADSFFDAPQEWLNRCSIELPPLDQAR